MERLDYRELVQDLISQHAREQSDEHGETAEIVFNTERDRYLLLYVGGIALADLDNDGDLDALVTHQFAPVSIYRNDSMAKSWLGLDSIGNGTTCNRDAIGTKVIIDSQTGRQSREVRESNGFSAQGDRRLLFGFGHQTQEVQV